MRLDITQDNCEMHLSDKQVMLVVDTGITIHYVIIPKVKHFTVSMYEQVTLVKIGRNLELRVDPPYWQNIKRDVMRAALWDAWS